MPKTLSCQIGVFVFGLVTNTIARVSSQSLIHNATLCIDDVYFFCCIADSQSTLSSGAFERPSPDEYQSISLEELTPIPPHAILDLLAHTPTPPTPPTPPTLSPPPPAATTTTRPTTRPPGGFYPTWVPPPPPWFHEPTPEELIQAGLFLQRSIPIAIMSSIIIWFFHYIS